jgi:hypothetical protein
LRGLRRDREPGEDLGRAAHRLPDFRIDGHTTELFDYPDAHSGLAARNGTGAEKGSWLSYPGRPETAVRHLAGTRPRISEAD